jgi:hypothetical protein
MTRNAEGARAIHCLVGWTLLGAVGACGSSYDGYPGNPIYADDCDTAPDPDHDTGNGIYFFHTMECACQEP